MKFWITSDGYSFLVLQDNKEIILNKKHVVLITISIYLSVFFKYKNHITPLSCKPSRFLRATCSHLLLLNFTAIAFDVDNRIAETGATEIYISILGPDGKPVSVEALGSGISEEENLHISNFSKPTSCWL
jgi:hypothetical protein